MARKQKRVRIERGIYRSGKTYEVCATPPGSKKARWKAIGEVGLMRARAERDAWATDVRAGNAPKRGRATVRELRPQWLDYLRGRVEAGDLAPRTYDSYEEAFRLHIEPEFASRSVQSIDVADLVEWHRKQRALGAAKWSIKGRWIAWRSFLKYAARMGHRDGNPSDELLPEERPKAGPSRMRILTRDEITRLLSAVEDDDEGDLLAMGIFTGLRASEILGGIFDEVDHAEEVIRVRYQMSRQGRRVKLKTEASRRNIVLMPELGKRLRRRRMRMLRSQGTDLVFQSQTGNALSYKRLREIFDRVAKRAGLHDVTLHTMRHTFASILISEGRTPTFVRDQLGHSLTSTTLDVYGHLFEAQRHAQEARDGLEANFGGALRGIKKGSSA